MKSWMLALAFVAVLGFTGIADAKKSGGKHSGIQGKIESIGQGSFTMTVHVGKKKAAKAAASVAEGQSLTVQYTPTTTIMINGAAGKLDGSMVGKSVSVIGGQDGQMVNATQITVSEGHHKKGKKSAV